MSSGASSPGQHVGVGHARHRDVLITLAPSVAGIRHSHQPRRQLVGQVSLQDALFDQHRVCRRVALVIHVERAAPSRHGAVVHHRALVAGHAPPHHLRERRRLLAIEVRLQPVPDRLMQQHARPSRSEHHFHLARRSIDRIQLNDRLPRRFDREVFRSLLRQEEVERHASAAARSPARRLVARLRQAEHVQARQRLRIFGKAAVRADHQDLPQLVGIAHPHFFNARIVRARRHVGAVHQLHLRHHVGFHRRQRHRIKVVQRLVGQPHHRLLRRTAGDHRRRARRMQNALRSQVVGVGIAGALARKHAHAAAHRNALRRRLHHALVERNRSRGLIFEVKVGEIAARGKRSSQVPLHVCLRQAVALKEKLLVHSHSI